MNEPTTFNTVLSVMLIRLVYHGTEQDALGKWAGDRIDVVREDFADFTNEDRAQWKDVSLVVKEAMKLGVEKWRKFLVEEESG